MHPHSRGGRAGAGVVLLTLCLLATACGTRLDREELVAAAQGGTATSESGGPSGDGAGLPGDGGGLSGDGGGPTGEAAGEPVDSVDGALGTSSEGANPSSETPGDGAPSGDAQAGGTTGGGTTGGGGTAVQAQCTGQKKPITIASVGNFSGVLGAIITQATQVIAGWAASVNAKGGINCHPIRYIVHDDGGDPARNQALVRQSVEQEGAIAFVYLGSPIAGAASVDYIQRNRIPVIGEEGGNPWSCVNSMYFPIMTACSDAIDGSYRVLKDVVGAGSRVGAMACIEVPFCSGWNDRAAEAARLAGLQLVSTQGVSLAQPDYTSACITARDRQSQMLVLGIDSNSMIRIQRSCRSVGLDVPNIGPGSAYATDAASKADLDGAWAASGVRFGTPDHPAYAEMLRTVRQYAPSIRSLAPNGAIGWVAAKVFELAAQGVSDDPTSDEILEGLWKIQNNDIGGLTKPLTFRRDQPVQAEPKCVFAIEIDEQAWQFRKEVCW
jgi:branched-chain amino acid transport system substrate-binding protein